MWIPSLYESIFSPVSSCALIRPSTERLSPVTAGTSHPVRPGASLAGERAGRQLERRLHRDHWWWRARRLHVLSTLRRLRPDEGWGRILQVECGEGHLFADLSELGEVEGVESDADLVPSDGPWRDRIHVGPFDGRFRPDDRFGLILMLDVLEHLPDPVASLRHALRLLEPGGRVLVTVPAFALLWSNSDVVSGHFVRYTRRSFRPVADAAGMRLLEMRYFFHWTWPAKLVLRVFEEIVRPGLRPLRVPPGWLNQALLALTRAEQRLLTPLGPPFGTSLMVIGGRDEG